MNINPQNGQTHSSMGLSPSFKLYKWYKIPKTILKIWRTLRTSFFDEQNIFHIVYMEMKKVNLFVKYGKLGHRTFNNLKNWHLQNDPKLKDWFSRGKELWSLILIKWVSSRPSLGTSINGINGILYKNCNKILKAFILV